MNNEQQDEIKRLGLIKIIPCKEEEKRDVRGNLMWHRDSKEIYYIVVKEYRKAESLDKEELK